MRALLLSDTHGVLDARIAQLAARCDVAVHAGDVGSMAVLDALRDACGKLIAVRGNNDVVTKWPVTDRAALAALPLQAEATLPGGTLMVVHGDAYASQRRHDRLRAVFATARAVLYGHSHRMIVDDARRPWVLNAGAAGRARTYGGPSCLVLHASALSWRVEEFRFALNDR